MRATTRQPVRRRPAWWFPTVAVAFCVLGGFPATTASDPPGILVSAPDATLVGGPAATANGPTDAGRFSRDGRFLAFTSEAGNMVTNDVNGIQPDVFLRDLASGRIALVSVNRLGVSGAGASVAPDISADGRFVAFLSGASDLVEGDANGLPDVFVRDMEMGVTRRISVAVDGGAADGESYAPRLTPDGRFVVFASRAGNLLSNPDTDGRIDVFLCDMVTGTMFRASPEARVGDGFDIEDYSVSDDGAWVVFTTPSTNRGPTLAGWVPTSAYRFERATGQVTRFDAEASDLPGYAGSLETVAMAFAPGRPRVALSSWTAGRSLTPVSNLVQVIDLAGTGASLVGQVAGPAGSRVDRFAEMAFSADGETLAFLQSVSAGAPGVIRVWNRQVGVSTPLDAASGQPVRAWEVALSQDGRRLAFTGYGAEAAAADPLSAALQLFTTPTSGGSWDLISASNEGVAAAGVEFAKPAFSPSGRHLSFVSRASGVVKDDRNRAADLFLHDVQTRGNAVMSSPDGAGSRSAAGISSLSVRDISADGRHVLFVGVAEHLVPGDADGVPGLFVRDVLGGRTRRVAAPGDPEGPSRSGFAEAVLSANGRHVAYVADLVVQVGDASPAVTPALFIHDLATRRTRRLTVDAVGLPLSLVELSQIRISADGRFVAHYQWIRSSIPRKQVILRDTASGRSWEVAALGVPFRMPLSLHLAGLGGRVFYGGNLASTGPAILFDPSSGISETVPYRTGMSSALSADGRRWVTVVPGSVGRETSISWRDPGDPAVKTRVLAGVSGVTRTFERVSADGQWVFLSERFADPVNPRRSTLGVHLNSEATTVIELDPSGAAVPGFPAESNSFSVSADGRLAAFASRSTLLTGDDPNDAVDPFVRVLPSGPTVRLPRGNESRWDRDGIHRPILSADGRWLVFSTWSDAFAAGDGNLDLDVVTVPLRLLPEVDQDGDGLDDGWEAAWFGGLFFDGAGDQDGDGVSDRGEFEAGTCPIDDLDRLRVALRSVAGGGAAVEWESRPGRRYQVQSSDRLEAGWTSVGEPVVGNGAVMVRSAASSGGAATFLRVRVERMPGG